MADDDNTVAFTCPTCGTRLEAVNGLFDLEGLTLAGMNISEIIEMRSYCQAKMVGPFSRTMGSMIRDIESGRQ